ncbi:unnamed protein product [Rhizoctonia solani]|uniref:Zn(2)-C6 fungal-type domain-containing protein n=1 Tax=Rhizoctonia solani TaxID=456999 RepID=A0A8H3E5G9_9AGAM|nr:unnamed protein product [Rhizoctonia solani]
MDNKDGIVHESQQDAADIKAAAGIRSRITVVCAECKRLKLKCDRRSPCSSCVKRETTARCVYSAAAAEKIDVQSLHNRVSALEDSWRAWTNTQPGQTPSIPAPGCMPSSSSHPPPPPPSTALIATTSTSEDLASALVGLDDVSSLWATHLGVNLAALSLRPSTPESDDDDDEPESMRHAKQIHMSFRIGVTLPLVSLLPPRHIRTHLWNAAQLVIGPHAGISRRTRTRFEQMCTDLEEGKSKKWPLSLFAVGTAGLAIGAQVVSESGLPLPHSPAPTGSTSPLPTPPCPYALYTLSQRSLSPNAHDTDAVLAALLHAARGTLDGRARIKPSVWPDICRAVGVARGMGLGLPVRPGIVVDEVEEWRRRVWWEVYCADLFTSDFIGLPPSIDDSTFSASLPHPDPADAEGDKNVDGLAYFVLKCRLAQLIKSHKRRLLDERPLPLESAASMERQVTEFIKDLPQEYRLDMTSSPSPLASEDETLLQIQRCELSSLAHSLILKTYYPFLKRGESSTNFATPHHAALACSNAAHSLVIASTTTHRYMPRTRPYSFAQQLFGGAVVAASVAITSPTGMVSQIALQDVRDALTVLRELDMYGHGLGIEGVASEAVRVVEVLVSKAEGAMGVAGSAGTKRKRDGEGLGVGFELPYVGASVVTAEDVPEHHEPHPHPHPPAPPPPIPTLSIPPPTLSIPPVQPPSDLPKRDRETKPTTKVSPYPKIGVRIRNNKVAKTVVKSRAGSERSVGASPVTSTSGSGMSPPGMQPGSGGMQPGSAGMQPGSAGMQPGSAGGMQPNSGGMQSNSGGMQPNSGGMQPGSAGGMQQPTTLQPPSNTMQPPPGGMQPPSPTNMQPPPNGLASNGIAPGTLPPTNGLAPPHPLPHLLPDQSQSYTEYQPYNESYYNGGYYAGYDYSMPSGGYKDGPSASEPGQDWYRQQQAQPQAGQWNAGFEMPWVAGGAQQGNQ